MSSPFLAEIRVVGFNFAPTGWATCDGQILPISQNTALFALLGTMYGGDGKSTFALPNIDGSVVVGFGQSSTGTQYYEGEASGVPYVTLLQSEMPLHTHQQFGSVDDAQFQSPQPDRELAGSSPGFLYQSNSSSQLSTLSPYTIGIAGSSLPHNNMQPSLALLFIIALQGVFPARS